MQTDVEDRAEIYFASIQGHEAFDEIRWIDSNVYGAISGREALAIEDQLPVHRLVATRRAR